MLFLLPHLAIDGLTLDSSRAVRRSITLLARELYACILRELEDVIKLVDGATNKQTQAPMPLTMEVVASDEELLFAALRACLQRRSDVNDIDDPATASRCMEAIELRDQADESGFLTASRLFLDQGKRREIPDILKIIKNKEAASIKIDKFLP